jgi:H+/Cl- antiporter ClcA
MTTDIPAPGAAGIGFLLTRRWWGQLARGLTMAVVGSLFALVFVGAVDVGIKALWPDDIDLNAWSGSFTYLVVLSAAGFVIGLIRWRSSNVRDIEIFDALEQGRVPPRDVPAGIVLALVSLIGGASLGPETPTGMLAGGTASAIGDRLDWDDDSRRVGVQCAVGGAWGGLFTSPYVSTLMMLELAHLQTAAVWPYLLIEALSAIVGFGIFYLAGGWADVIRLVSVPDYHFHVVDLVYGALIGAAGAAVAIGFVQLTRRLRRLAARLRGHVILRSTAAGLVLGALAMALPLTLFNGAAGLAAITSDRAQLGIGLIVVSAVFKLVATSGALAFGYVGGPIFPALFAGGALGVTVHHLIPAIPVAVAVVGGMAAVPAGLVSVPYSLAILAMLIAASPIESAAPVLTAATISVLIVRGLAAPPPVLDLEVRTGPVSERTDADPSRYPHDPPHAE